MNSVSASDAKVTPNAHFLSLPREIREEIYQQCIPKGPYTIFVHRNTIGVVRKQHPHWLLTSKQIFFEAVNLVYGEACLYHNLQMPYNATFNQQVWWGYFDSFHRSEIQLAVRTWPHVIPLITSIAIDAEIEVGPDRFNRLVESYLHRIGEFTGLRKLYICIIPRTPSQLLQFRNEIRMSELRIFHITNLMRPVERLKGLIPNDCELVWKVPQDIRPRGYPVAYPALGAVAEIADLMKEVEVALDATVPRSV